MTPQEAAAILEEHNRWRRGEEIPMLDPKTIGEAIDAAVEFIKKTTKHIDYG